ncbi:disulfide bond formation protein DsbC [Bordetella genomosp. 8]|uniref:Thiol:disulfide interchange protein n=1 Tax=Bordetella genomosp. 8 TaxID=1416806 RepID=A0A1W6YSQ2_9BORD|nr:DsbC family protein [Bordetella genomosp. 8]ARP83939.1 disulfide bond formation protein DsbC [Bordetella genomosp. 8]
MNNPAWLSAIRAAAAAAAIVAAVVVPASASAADKVISTQSAGQPQPGETVTSTSGAGPAAKVTSTAGANPGEKVISTATGQAGTADTEQVGALFSQRFPDLAVTAVRRTPYGLYEVQVGMDLIYTDAKVGWVMEGPLIDAATRQDVTRERQEQIGAISFDQLPLKLAVKRVTGDGSRAVAIFEDPNCGYCKQLRHTLEGIPNLTVYTFIYPILAPDSRTKARDIWCAQKPGQAWDDWMVRGKMPPASGATANCNAPIDQVLALGQRLMVRGTPTLFFPDGSRVSGALPQDELLAHLDKSSKKGG